MLYFLLPEQEVICDQSHPFVKELYESCFRITLSVRVSENNQATHQITLTTRPEEESSYQVLVSVLLSVNGIEHWVDFDLWQSDQTVLDLSVNAERLRIAFGLDIHDVLAPRDLHSGGGFRSLRVLSSQAEYFVNAAALNELGGSLFEDWYTRKTKGESTIVATELEDEELDVLLTSCCAYSSVIVTRQNFDILIGVAKKYKIVGVLRAIEHYLLNSKGIHVISKLDMSCTYKFALLGSSVLMTMGNQLQRKELLLDYLNKNKIPYCPKHLIDLLEVKNVI